MPDEFIKQFAQPSDRLERIRQFWDELTSSGIPNKITLEIGCGHGHWLVAYAEQNPQKCCIGIDLITKRIELSKRKKEKTNLPHLHFFKADAMEFLQGIGSEAALHETILLFPDPWPKKRHHKRRLINEEFLDQLAARTQPGGKLYFRTDYDEYFNWSEEKIKDHHLWNPLEGFPWPFEHETYFQNILPKHHSLAAVLANL